MLIGSRSCPKAGTPWTRLSGLGVKYRSSDRPRLETRNFEVFACSDWALYLGIALGFHGKGVGAGCEHTDWGLEIECCCQRRRSAKRGLPVAWCNQQSRWKFLKRRQNRPGFWGIAGVYSPWVLTARDDYIILYNYNNYSIHCWSRILLESSQSYHEFFWMMWLLRRAAPRGGVIFH